MKSGMVEFVEVCDVADGVQAKIVSLGYTRAVRQYSLYASHVRLIRFAWANKLRREWVRSRFS